MGRKRAASVIALLLIVSLRVLAEDILMVFEENGYPPFYLKSPDGVRVVSGMYVEFLEEFMKAHPEFTIVMAGYSRIRMDQMMDRGDARAFSLQNPMFAGGKAGDFIWSDPIWHTADCLFSRRTDPIVFRRNEDLFGKRIGCILGNGYGEFDALFATGKILDERVVEENQAYRMLEKGRIDGFFGNVHTTPYNMKLFGFDGRKFVVAEKMLYEFDLMAMIDRRNTVFRDRLNDFIAASRKNGLLARIEAKWLK